MGYYLLDNRNPNRDMFYTSRNKALVGVVVHCTAGLEDLDFIGTDHSAENTARYAATTSRAVSWHSGNDSDSTIELLPASYTGWHCRGYNSSTYGHEISKRHMVWSSMPDRWVTETLTRAAKHMGKIARENGIPVRKITKTQLDKAIAAGNPSMGGFVGHRELDPTRRTDPGADFPWDRFLSIAQSTTTEEEDMPTVEEIWGAKVGRGDNRRSLAEVLVNAERDAAIARALAERAAKGDTLTDAQMAAVITAAVVAAKYAP